MKRTRFLNRRKFIAATAAAAAGSAAGCKASRGAWRFFTAGEAQTMVAICEQIIPADDAPGAAWAGVIRYIDRQLVGKFKEHQKTYRDGIAAVNRLAGAPFETLSPEKQTEILKKMEKDKQIRPFFDLAIAHTMQGFYGSPRHGGNRDWISWQMLGIPISPSRGREHYDRTQGVKS